mgnify:CR=1 FL=1
MAIIIKIHLHLVAITNVTTQSHRIQDHLHHFLKLTSYLNFSHLRKVGIEIKVFLVFFAFFLQQGLQLVPAGAKLVPAGTSWYQSGTSWYQSGTSWYQAGTTIVAATNIQIPDKKHIITTAKNYQQ